MARRRRNPKAEAARHRLHLMRDGKIIASADSDIQLLRIFHGKTSYSFSHGRKYEGWDIVRDPFTNPCRNPGPSAKIPRKTLLTLGLLKQLEVLDPVTGGVGTINLSKRWLAWDTGRRCFHICTVRGHTKAAIPSAVSKAHQKFHELEPQGSPFVGDMPTPKGKLRQIGLLKGLIYTVPRAVPSPEKNKNPFTHAFGDTGHRGGSYSQKVMPALKEDEAGNLFIVRRKGNIFRIDQWIRG